MKLTFLIIPAIILTFIFVFVPGFLWLIDRLFRKSLGGRIFKPSWNIWGIAAAAAFWLADRLWVYLK